MQRKYHPDKIGSVSATRMSQELNRAYQVLKDPELRDVYDRLGEVGLRKMKKKTDEDEDMKGDRKRERAKEEKEEAREGDKDRERSKGDSNKAQKESKEDVHFWQETNKNFSYYSGT